MVGLDVALFVCSHELGLVVEKSVEVGVLLGEVRGLADEVGYLRFRLLLSRRRLPTFGRTLTTIQVISGQIRVRADPALKVFISTPLIIGTISLFLVGCDSIL